jgi:hypothetical protein
VEGRDGGRERAKFEEHVVEQSEKFIWRRVTQDAYCATPQCEARPIPAMDNPCAEIRVCEWGLSEAEQQQSMVVG